jgi:hypothetical protein|tara:strand:+ start:912 stop:1130 length:219 start_codon:yes stop_codon:yes gene_type:complete
MQLDKVEVRLRVLEAVARHCSSREWNDVDIICEKVKIISDFLFDQRTVGPRLAKPELRQPDRKKPKIPTQSP